MDLVEGGNFSNPRPDASLKEIIQKTVTFEAEDTDMVMLCEA